MNDHFSHNADHSGGKKRVCVAGQAEFLEDSRCVVTGGLDESWLREVSNIARHVQDRIDARPYKNQRVSIGTSRNVRTDTSIAGRT